MVLQTKVNAAQKRFDEAARQAAALKDLSVVDAVAPSGRRRTGRVVSVVILRGQVMCGVRWNNTSGVEMVSADKLKIDNSTSQRSRNPLLFSFPIIGASINFPGLNLLEMFGQASRSRSTLKAPPARNPVNIKIPKTIVDVTPALAKRYLKTNVVNRPVDDAKVRAIANLMKGGAYKDKKGLTLTNGLITDGQHRLLAVIKSGSIIPFTIYQDTVKAVRTSNPARERNVDGFMVGGRFRPIRQSDGYDKSAAGDDRSRKLPYSELSLAQWVRRHKGMKYSDDDLQGELRPLSAKEGRTSGLLNKHSRYTPERMMDACNTEGYRDSNGQPFRHIGDFLQAVDADNRGQETISHPEKDYDFSQNPSPLIEEAKLHYRKQKEVVEKARKEHQSKLTLQAYKKLERAESKLADLDFAWRKASSEDNEARTAEIRKRSAAQNPLRTVNGLFSRAGGAIVGGIKRKRATKRYYREVGKEAVATARRTDAQSHRTDLIAQKKNAKAERIAAAKEKKLERQAQRKAAIKEGLEAIKIALRNRLEQQKRAKEDKREQVLAIADERKQHLQSERATEAEARLKSQTEAREQAEYNREWAQNERERKAYEREQKRDAKASNPSPSKLHQLHKTFQGRAATRVEHALTSKHNAAFSYRLGGLVYIKLADGRSLQFAQKDNALLDASANNQLMLLNVRFAAPRVANPSRLQRVGELSEVCYQTGKAHLHGGATKQFYHFMAEDGGHHPTLYLDAEGFPVIRGGSYEIESRGIVN